MDINTVALSGNVARDAEMRCTQSGKPVISFPLAVGEMIGGGDGQASTRTSYFDVVCFFGTDRLRDALGKGARVSVSGRLRQTRWDDGGKTRYGVEVVASSLDLAAGRIGTTGGGVSRGPA
jgi:single-strand DNA-binding protein